MHHCNTFLEWQLKTWFSQASGHALMKSFLCKHGGHMWFVNEWFVLISVEIYSRSSMWRPARQLPYLNQIRLRRGHGTQLLSNLCYQVEMFLHSAKLLSTVIQSPGAEQSEKKRVELKGLTDEYVHNDGDKQQSKYLTEEKKERKNRGHE